MSEGTKVVNVSEQIEELGRFALIASYPPGGWVVIGCRGRTFGTFESKEIAAKWLREFADDIEKGG